jgi:hypothetical protein
VKSIFELKTGDPIEAVSVPGTPFVWKPMWYGSTFCVLRDGQVDRDVSDRLWQAFGGADKSLATARAIGEWLQREAEKA